MAGAKKSSKVLNSKRRQPNPYKGESNDHGISRRGRGARSFGHWR